MLFLLLLTLSFIKVDPSNDAAENLPEAPIHETVDVYPVPEGGQQAAIMTIVKSLRYPSYALEKRVEGLVAVEFIVEIDGSISQLSIAKGIGYGCDEEAMRVVSLLKKWSPGILDGEAVRTRMKFPVKFKLG
jgi:periplasmic protein TonB